VWGGLGDSMEKYTHREKILKLSNYEYLKGLIASLDNAMSLIKAAKLLRENKFFGHSNSLLILSLEECAKAKHLFDVIYEETSLDKNVFERHFPKLKIALIEIFGDNELHRKLEKYVNKTKKIKERGLYVNYDDERNKWVTPQDWEHEAFVDAISLAN